MPYPWPYAENINHFAPSGYLQLLHITENEQVAESYSLEAKCRGEHYSPKPVMNYVTSANRL